MTRWLAGTFDPRGRKPTSRLANALAPHVTTLAVRGPLRVAYSGAAQQQARGPLCLLDGFLDNPGELRNALELPTDGSAEELLAAGWLRWGSALPARMRGDFALLIWDEDRGEGLIARDHLGVRSLFLHEDSGGVSFASEIRHLLALVQRRPSPDPTSVAHWLTMGQRPGSATLYSRIRRLEPGVALMLNRNGTREQRYWAPSFAEPEDWSLERTSAEMGGALERAVRRRTSPEGATGVLMSGGLDSAAIAAVAAAHAPDRVSAYSATFPEHPDVDESALIDELRRSLALPGITAEVRPGGLIASAVESIQAWQMPLRSWGDFWALPLLRAAAEAGTRITLGGDGGDEVFGVRSYLLADRLRRGRPFGALALAHELPGAGERPPRRELARVLAELALTGALPYGLHEPARRRSAGRSLPSWLNADSARGLLESDDPLAWKRLDGPRWWAEVAHGLTRRVEEIGVFEHQRRRAASAGLEARHPMFDLDLIELSLRQPPLVTFDRYRSRPVLRSAMRGMLPDTVRMRPAKALFDSLLVDCLAGPDGMLARRLLCDPEAELRAYLDQAELERTLFGPSFKRRDPFGWMWQLWRLTTAECWLRSQADPNGRSLPVDARPTAARVAM